MKPILQDVTVQLGICINGYAVTSGGVCNRVAICECAFILTPFSNELKGASYVLNGLRRYFSYYQMMLMTRSCVEMH